MREAIRAHSPEEGGNQRDEGGNQGGNWHVASSQGALTERD